jgi:hypothetical protein
MELKEVVRAKYGQTALRANVGGSSCCAAVDCSSDPITFNLYDAAKPASHPNKQYGRYLAAAIQPRSRN